MSRRKIKNKKKPQSCNSMPEGFWVNTSYRFMDSSTEEMDMGLVSYEMTREELRYMPIYTRAHELMPESHSYYMDPNAYKEHLAPAIEVLTEAGQGKIIESDTILRALGILGHTPVEESIKALSQFAESNHSLAPVAGLALAECSSMYSGGY